MPNYLSSKTNFIIINYIINSLNCLINDLDFNIQVNCSNSSASDLNFILNVYFEMVKNNLQPNDIQQLFSMPPLNFSIQYRKNCIIKNQLNRFNNNNTTYNYTVAYIIIGVLFGFAFLFASSGIIMFFHNKVKHRQLHAKYESLHARLNKQQHELNNEKTNNSNQVKNNMYTKNVQINKNNRNLYVTKKSKQIESTNSNDEQQQQQNEETQNIYESVQESSVNMTNQNEEQSMLPKKSSRHLLNLTTNTIQSVYNNTVSISSSNLLRSNSNKNSIEMCTKYKRDQIELDKCLMEGTFSRIYEGRLFINDDSEQDIDSSPPNAADSAYDNFDTNNIYKLNNSSSHNRLSRCLKFDKEKGYIKVLVKTVKNNASLEQTDMMLKESCVFRGLKHKNLNSIIGLCIEPDSHTLALFPFNEMGNLKLYLNSIRELKIKELISSKPSKNENNVNIIYAFSLLLIYYLVWFKIRL